MIFNVIGLAYSQTEASRGDAIVIVAAWFIAIIIVAPVIVLGMGATRLLCQ